MIDIREVWESEDTPECFVQDMYEYLEEKCRNGAEMGALNDCERVLFLTLYTQYGADNFGLAYVLRHAPCHAAWELQNAFMSIGAQKAAAICKKAAMAYGQELPAQPDARQAMIDLLENEATETFLRACEEEFDACCDELTQLNFNYIMKHRGKFS